ncbi:shikimate kinase 3, chloroplastic-like isoform X2 [Diospyros lotus]|nr:shikimate kinase 3, chloroplastic-like isoform X2 [Diospyros lotus]
MSFDGNWLLKSKGEEVAPYLNERCIFLVGMMGSGKTTVGKVLSEALAYSFVDSDKYVEEALGGSPVTQIFKQFGESYFRDYESEALRNLSLMPRQVVATGGGAVVRDINWKYMKKGLTVYLQVPLDALARRIAAVGMNSRPLLDFGSGDAYTKIFMSLFTLSKKRRQAYSNADVTVSLQHIAAQEGLEDLSDITPSAIALEVLVQIQGFLLRNEEGMSI